MLRFKVYMKIAGSVLPRSLAALSPCRFSQAYTFEGIRKERIPGITDRDAIM